MESFHFGEQKATSLRHENTDNICEANFQVQNLSRAADFAKRKYPGKWVSCGPDPRSHAHA